MELEFKLEEFQGPLDLLLSLINRNEVDILDIPIVSITSQFREIVEGWKEFYPDAVSDYLLMTAKLIRIKSEVLLAGKIKAEEEDPRRELAEQLIEYQSYKKISEYLKSLDTQLSFKRDPENLPFLKVDIPPEIDSRVLESTFRRLMENLSRKEKLPEIIRSERITLKNKISEMKSRIDNKKRPIQEFFNDAGDRLDIIITFLAVLELYKMNIIRFIQKNDDILLTRRNG